MQFVFYLLLGSFAASFILIAVAVIQISRSLGRLEYDLEKFMPCLLMALRKKEVTGNE